MTEHSVEQPDTASVLARQAAGVTAVGLPPGDGRTAQFATIVERYQGSLLRYVGRMVGSEQDQAEDVVQECFLRLHRAWPAGKPPMERVGAWLFTVSHNLTMDLIRKRVRKRRALQKSESASGPSPAGRPSAPAGEPCVLEQITRSEAAVAALLALDHLPGEQKQVVLMKVLQGLTFRQIAKVTGLSLGSVNKQLNQALEALARQLKRSGHL